MYKEVNPNTTFYSYYFFPRAPRSDFAVLYVSNLEQPANECTEASFDWNSQNQYLWYINKSLF